MIYEVQRVIGVVEYGLAVSPVGLIGIVERDVRDRLAAAAHTTPAEVRLGWTAYVPGTGPDAPPERQRATVFLPWAPGEAVPENATALHCRGRVENGGPGPHGLERDDLGEFDADMRDAHRLGRRVPGLTTSVVATDPTATDPTATDPTTDDGENANGGPGPDGPG